MAKASSRAVRYDKDVYRIEREGTPVAMALRLSNDRWGLYDSNERKLTTRTFDKPKDVAKAFDEINPSAGDAE